MRVWQAHDKAVLALAFTPDGAALATAGDGDPGVRLWDRATGYGRRVSLFQEPVTTFALAPDGATLAVAHRGAVELWDVADEDRPRLRIDLGRHTCAELAFAADGRMLLSAGTRHGADGPALQGLVWGTNDGRVRADFREPTGDRIGQTHALTGGLFLWAHGAELSAADQRATLTDVLGGWSPAAIVTRGPVRAAALAPGGRVLAAAVRGGVSLWAIPAVKPPPEPFRATGRGLLGWRHRRPEETQPLPGTLLLDAGLTLPGAAERIDAVAFSPDGRRLLTGGAVGTVRLWDVPELLPPNEWGHVAWPDVEAREAAAFDWRIGPVAALAFAPDGLTAAAGSATGRLVVWDVDG
jgi:WD40 repeat protein